MAMAMAMAAVLRRLGSERPGWRIEAAVRALGVALLALGGWAAGALHRLLAPHGPGAAGAAPYGLALLVVLGWCLGMALLAEGPGLFRLIPVPDRALVPFID